MATIRVRVVYQDNTWRVNLPTYQMVPGSFKPLIAKKVDANGVLLNVDPVDPTLQDLTCLVEVPDSHIDPETGQLDEKAIRKLYKGQPKWDREGVVDDVQR